MKTIEEVLDGITYDKHKDTYTTSFKMKADVWDFVNTLNPSDKVCVELGTFHGHTTRVLANAFRHVYTIDNGEDRIRHAMLVNSVFKNITYLKHDLYNTAYNQILFEDQIHFAFIDASHAYNDVMYDIARVLHMNIADEFFIAFDDYGLSPDVHTAIDEYVNSGILEIVKHIGHSGGYNFGHNPPRILRDSEGVICKVHKDKIEYSYA